MLSSERRGSSARRGMTVLGKIPAVPKPINLPSQRLENRGLDPNVELVPRGSVSWGSTGRSPPTSSNAWGTPAQASSPPSSGGAWGSRTGSASAGSSGVSGGAAFSGPGNIPRPSSGGSGTRPTSGGPGARPSSAESLELTQQSSADSFSSGGHSSSAWGARPSSASGVLGQAQPQLAPSPSRPRSADIARPSRNLSEFGEQSGPQPSAGHAAWGNRGPPRRLGEEPHQVSRFQLTRTDFPTLGSEKNPDLRPQQSNSGADRGTSVEAKVPHPEERGPPTPPGPHEDASAVAPVSGYGHPDRGASESWRRESGAFQGPPGPGAEGNWHRDGPPARPSFGGPVAPSESWRREGGPSGGPSDDNWRRGGAPPVGQYGPPPGPGHYAHEGPGFMHQGRFGPGPAGFGRGAPGPGGYGHPGEMYGNSGPLLRPGGPMHGMRPNMFPGPVPYEGFYGPPPGAGYQGMEDPERMMMGPYGGFAQHRGPPPDAFGRFPHGGMNQGPRHPPSGGVRERERGESVGGDGYHDAPSFHKEGPDGAGPKEGRVYGDRHGGGGPEGVENRRFALHRGGGGGGADVHGQGPRGGSSVPPGGHRDWGAAASSDEPMDFSKPVFEEEVVSASPLGSGKQSPSPVLREESSVEEVKREDVRSTADTDKSVVEVESARDEEKKEVLVVKSDAVAGVRSSEDASSSKSKVVEVSEGSVPGERKFPSVVDKEVVARVVTKEVPGKWERSSKRGDSQLREVIGPGSSGVPQSSNVRSGQPSSVGAGKSSILGNAPRHAGADLPHPVQEKSVSVSAPSSESEAPSGAEKGRLLRRPESPKVESAVGSVEGSVPPPGPVQESLGKEGPKAKGKSSSHDGEKEWRPKVPIAEASPRGAAPAVSKAGVSSSPSGADVTEGSGGDSESGPKPGSYDYDEQRLKMKEIAAQRARQLQKEEEERIKDQKAKARAKLEELDRRSTVVPSGSVEDAALDSWKPSVEVEEGEPAEESPAVESEASVPSGSVSTKRVVRNEHGKRERDRKASGRKAVVGESAKGKVNGGVVQVSALLPPPLAMAGPLLSTPAAAPGPEAYGSQQPRESRHRGRPEKKQLVAKSEEGVRAVAVAPPVAFPDTPSSEAEANGGWSMDKPLPQESNSAPALHSVPSLAEGSGPVRKNKSSRHVRNRPRPEAAPMTAESIQFGDIVSGVHIPSYQPIVGGDPSVESGSASFHVESSKDVNVSVSGDALTGDEGSAVSTNGDASGKRLQRKSRSARRGPGRSDRGSLEQRAAEKSHVGDSMVWAPVRSPGAGAVSGNKVEHGPSFDPPPPKEESSSAQQQARAKRAEMERYTPKPLMKYQESSDHAAASGAGPQHSPAAVVPSSAGVVPSSVSSSESTRATSSAESKQSSSGDGKVNPEVRGVESGTKVGKSHGSWRQRGSGSERVSEVAKESPAAVNVSGSVPADSGPPRPRAEQRGVGGHGPSRRHPTASDHLLATPPASAAVAPSAPAPAASVVGAVPVSAPASEREHPADKKLYQPPRPGSAAAPRVQDHRVPEPRGQDIRGQDFRGQDHRGQDYRAQGPHGSEPKRHDQGPAPHSRHSNAPSDRAGPIENPGSQQHPQPHSHRNGGGQHHPRSQNPDKEQAPSHQTYTTPHSQQKSHAGAVPKEPSHPSSRERDGVQEPPSRGGGQHFVESGEQVSNHRGGRPERDQASRPSSGQQRGQGHWQQTGVGEGYRSRAPPAERESAVAPQLGRSESSKPAATESQRPVPGEHAGQQASKAVHQGIPSPKGELGNWEGAGDGPAASRGRDYSHGRRGRFGGRSGPRNMEMESRREGPSSKQRLVINATGGAVPSPVAG